MGLDCDLDVEKKQWELLEKIIARRSNHVAILLAYSNNIWRYAVPEVWEWITRAARTDDGGNWEQKLPPDSLKAIARMKIEQSLIWKQWTNIADIKKIYAHVEWANQVSWWLKDTFNWGIEIELMWSNGYAINAAAEENSNEVAAIWPMFAKRVEQVVLKPKIHNDDISETSFALLEAPWKKLIIPEFQHDGNYGALLYWKMTPNSDGDTAFNEIIKSNHVRVYGNRTTNSPKSWKVVKWQDVISRNPDHIRALIESIQKQSPELRFLSTNSKTGYNTIIEWTGSIEEFNYLGGDKTPVFQVPVH